MIYGVDARYLCFLLKCNPKIGLGEICSQTYTLAAPLSVMCRYSEKKWNGIDFFQSIYSQWRGAFLQSRRRSSACCCWRTVLRRQHQEVTAAFSCNHLIIINSISDALSPSLTHYISRHGSSSSSNSISPRQVTPLRIVDRSKTVWNIGEMIRRGQWRAYYAPAFPLIISSPKIVKTLTTFRGSDGSSVLTLTVTAAVVLVSAAD